MNRDELEQAITWDAEQYIPISLTDLYIDYQVLGPTLSGKEGVNDVVLVAVPRMIVDSFIKTIEILGLEVGVLETNLSSIARAVIPKKDQSEIIALVDVGGEKTNIAIFDKAIRITGSIPKGGVDFTRSISEKLKLNILEAEELKNHEGLPGKNNKVKDAMEPAMLEIIAEIKKAINYYFEKTNANKKAQISKVLVCGGNASVPGFVEFLGERTGVKTLMGNPWANISVYPLKPVPKLEAPMYTTAIGLAMKGN
ncbi:MAG: Cell division protein FtsA [candidate division CPR2 bacterium GW2011_GWC1_41_48]|uniref:Cell division protein FtsA n=1 Tax=candidate division CPR2 bacterium GW2011_GWC1_41_48 TaxID=1618344 RepID=A0A0G0W886_UNCC2|nr:MAG: Cell division protein FtsA [candidate division CPR2 bacterium GW2011_GWC2_39_35]KKR28190.1 MAG: Cell division protein FtsA [candidate division CPR2 bacterium GW2011_GWD1_39_7]KKR29276.1 MAG: Cell division protein FtsA [candidate division CPR2 bacterium GW2011_GWD2_39_7]KKS09190.1 MAG: Cell division protein FtsA [candidate division CPR2 bacterium GW2011_GWC1_41_48]OGB60359.1 MAG: hypothetical protein A2Y27_03100 [candidate division CPR2 bacterium GWD1_39_7]OGB70941.1 MAG: hypothetical p